MGRIVPNAAHLLGHSMLDEGIRSVNAYLTPVLTSEANSGRIITSHLVAPAESLPMGSF